MMKPGDTKRTEAPSSAMSLKIKQICDLVAFKCILDLTSNCTGTD